MDNQPTDNDPINQRLGKVRAALQNLSTGNLEADSLKKELAIIVKQLDDIMQSLQLQTFGVEQHKSNTALDRDLDREVNRVRQPLKPETFNDPRRID